MYRSKKLILVTATVFALASCGGGNNDDADNDNSGSVAIPAQDDPTDEANDDNQPDPGDNSNSGTDGNPDNNSGENPDDGSGSESTDTTDNDAGTDPSENPDNSQNGDNSGENPDNSQNGDNSGENPDNSDNGGANVDDSDNGTGSGAGGDSSSETDSDVTDSLPGDALAARIQGAWMGQCNDSASTVTSSRAIIAITDTQIAMDLHEFDGADCQGVARGYAFPLRTYDYVLGSDVAAGENVTAAEINLVVRQLSSVGLFRDGAMLDQARYDIIGIDENGNLLRTYRETTNVNNRPQSLDDAVTFTQKTSLTPDSLPIEAFFGSYSPGCQPRAGGFSSLVTETFEADKSIWVEEFHFNPNCQGAPDAAMQRITDFVWGDEFVSIFGDRMRRVQTTLNPKTILYGEDAVSGIDLGTLRVRYDAATLIDGTLLRGDCVNRVDQCKSNAEHYSDMVDYEFQSNLRYRPTAP